MCSKKLIIVGDSAFAEVAREYFEVDSEFDVVAHAVERAYMKRDEFHGVPVVPFEDLEANFSPSEYNFHVALTYGQLNRARTRLIAEAKAKGYQPASYISSRAFCWRNVKLGEHVFIFEDNTVQPYVTIGDNVVLWSGNHIGHHSTVGSNCFISSHVVISGYCQVGDNTFMGVNSTVADNVKIGRDNWIGPGLTILKDTEENQLFGAVQADPSRVPARKFFKVKG